MRTRRTIAPYLFVLPCVLMLAVFVYMPLIQNAAETTPWLDNAVDASVADAFMRGGQAIAADIETPEEVLKEVQAAAAKLQAVKK